MKIAYNTAGNNSLGMGHVYSSLRLSDKLQKDHDAVILYLLPSDSKPAISVVREAGHMFRVLDPSKPEEYTKEIRDFQADVVINDILYVREEFMKSLTDLDTLVVNIEHIKEPQSLRYADIIFNSIYPPAITPKGNYYYGPRYATLREIFKDLPKKKGNKDCKNFYIAFGGSDPSGFTLRAVEALDRLEDITATILVGGGFNHKIELEGLLKKTRKGKFTVKEIFDISYINQADIGLVSGGNTIYELAATGTPSLALSHNEMEAERLKLFSGYGLTLDVGGGDLSESDLLLRVKELMENYELREKMSERQQELVDGKGLERMVEVIINGLVFRKLNWKEGSMYPPSFFLK